MKYKAPLSFAAAAVTAILMGLLADCKWLSDLPNTNIAILGILLVSLAGFLANGIQILTETD